EAGRAAEAVEEMLALAQIYIEREDTEGAVQNLQDALAYDPTNQRAIGMVRDLGYEILEEGEQGTDAGAEQAYDEPRTGDPYGDVDIATGPAQPGGYDRRGGFGDAPARGGLPAYELDSPGEHTSPDGRAYARGAMEPDDPFGTEAPLPSFPLAEEPPEA